MQNGRFRNLVTLAGASLCLLATSALAQTPTRADSLGMVAPVDTMSAMTAPAPMMTDTAAVVVEERGGFPWGLLGLLGLLGLMKKPDRDTTVVRNETYTPPDPRPRNMGTGSTTDDRTMNLGNRPPNDPTSRS
ncbi:MAG TPA: hypothetical protein VNJ04_18040 [Gemmatimonadaceae bacterium]|nr:hypothetical protein [Gemmatimonadaceae bacterium]